MGYATGRLDASNLLTPLMVKYWQESMVPFLLLLRLCCRRHGAPYMQRREG